jgi:ATP-dependent DNA ligase
VSKTGTIPLTHSPPDYAETNDAERSNDKAGDTRCGIVRYSTLWLKPVLVGQFEFREWTSDNHLRHSKFVALRDDKKAREVRREMKT